MTSWWRHLSFLIQLFIFQILLNLQTSLLVQTFNNIKCKWQKCKWLWQKLKVTGEGQMSHKINKWWFLVKHYTQRHHTWYQGTLQKVTSKNSIDISFLDLEEMSRSHHNVKCRRHGGVCVLWMLLVFDLIDCTLFQTQQTRLK